MEAFLTSIIITFLLLELIIQDKFQNLFKTIWPHLALAVTFLMGQILKLKQLLWYRFFNHGQRK